MPSGREELRRGVRNLIETASRELGALADQAPPTPPVIEAGTTDPSETTEVRPVLQLVRPGPAATGLPVAAGTPPMPAAEASAAHTRKGVCAAYYVTRRCWEVPDAYCNQALHVCMLRECPVYHLNREQLEERFSRKFTHLW